MTDESTTPDLVERARAMFAAGDRGDIDAAIGFFAPDVVWEMVGPGIPSTARRRFSTSCKSGSTDTRTIGGGLEEALDMRNDVVLVVYLDSGRPGGSTFTVQERGVVVIEWTGGLIVRVTDFDYDQFDEARATAERLARERADG